MYASMQRKSCQIDSPGLVNFTVGLVNSALEVIPLFCTVHPLLRMTLRHPRWQRFFPLVWKEQARAAFTDLKLLFAIKCCRSADSFLVCYRKTRKWKKCAWSQSLQWFFTSRPSSCGIIKMSWLRLWIMGAVKPVGQLYGSPTVLSTIIVKSVGKVAFFTSSFPSSPRPWPNVDQNVNVCACNCSVISQHWTGGTGGI